MRVKQRESYMRRAPPIDKYAMCWAKKIARPSGEDRNRSWIAQPSTSG